MIDQSAKKINEVTYGNILRESRLAEDIMGGGNETEAILSEMIQMVESAGYTIPEGLNASEFISDVEAVLASGEPMDENTRAYLTNAVRTVREALARR